MFVLPYLSGGLVGWSVGLCASVCVHLRVKWCCCVFVYVFRCLVGWLFDWLCARLFVELCACLFGCLCVCLLDGGLFGCLCVCLFVCVVGCVGCLFVRFGLVVCLIRRGCV